MRKILEAIFRQPLRLLLLIIVLPVLGLGTAFFLPRTYQSTATLWAMQRYQIIGATGSESNLLATPAETQATALGELLQSRTFALAVANASSLPATLSAATRSDPQARDTALFDAVSKNVRVAPQGYNLFVITYANRDPSLANQVVTAVIKNYGQQAQGFSIVEGQRFLDAYQTQLAKAQQDAAAAAKAETAYIATHNTETVIELNNDPQYLLLHTQTQQAQSVVGDLRQKIASLSQDIATTSTSTDNLYQVLDTPTARAESRTKTLALAGGVSLGLALAACALYLMLVIRRDRSLYTGEEVRLATGLPVVLQLPHLSGKSASHSVKSLSGADLPALSNGHR